MWQDPPQHVSQPCLLLLTQTGNTTSRPGRQQATLCYICHIMLGLSYHICLYVLSPLDIIWYISIIEIEGLGHRIEKGCFAYQYLSAVTKYFSLLATGILI